MTTQSEQDRGLTLACVSHQYVLFYEENIFSVNCHGESDWRMALKPMNCPGHMLLFGSRLRSLGICRSASPSRRPFIATRRAGRCTACCR